MRIPFVACSSMQIIFLLCGILAQVRQAATVASPEWKALWCSLINCFMLGVSQGLSVGGHFTYLVGKYKFIASVTSDVKDWANSSVVGLN